MVCEQSKFVVIIQIRSIRDKGLNEYPNEGHIK